MNTSLPAAAALSALLALAPSARAETLHRSGPSGERLDLVLLADGYLESERPRYEEHARRVWSALQRTEPFSRYLGLLNVHLGFRASPRSGAGQDNAYGTRFRETFGTRLLADRRLLILQDAARAGGQADVVLVLVNSARRGGTAAGTIGYASSGAGTGTAIHELGHLIGGLGDEYSSMGGTPVLTREQAARLYPNLTTSPSRAALPWVDWVEPSTSVPAGLFTQGVSAYRGGGVYSDGIYRPERSCRMRSDTASFCAVCRQHLVVALHHKARPLALQVVSAAGGARRAEVRSALPADVWRTRWTGVAGQGLTALVPAGVGASVALEDATPWVRGVWRDELRYRFVVSGVGTAAPAPPSAGTGTPGTVVGVTSRLRVRAQATTSSAVLGYLDPGADVRVLGPARSGFLPIAYGSGTGFVGEHYVRLQSSGLAQALASGPQ